MGIHPEILLKVPAVPPLWLEDWLRHQGSLTARLESCSDAVKLQVLSTAWKKPNWWDRFCLKIHTEDVFCREIMISANTRPCWYARTLIPKTGYQQDTAFFDRLSQESLAQLVFDEPRVKRHGLFFYPVDESCLEFYWPKAYFNDSEEKILWLRASAFEFDEQAQFFLCEIMFARNLRMSL